MNQTGCELPSRAKSNLRLAIKTILLIQGCLAASNAAAEEPAKDLDTVTAAGVRIILPWYTPGLWGGFQLGGQGYDTSSYSEPDQGPSLLDPEPAKDFITCNPVDVTKGTKVWREVDFQSGSDDGLDLQRYYNQAWTGRGQSALGYWITNFDLRISFDTMFFGEGQGMACYPAPANPCTPDVRFPDSQTGTLYAHREDGDTIRFDRNNNGEFMGSAEAPLAKIVLLADGNYKLIWPDGKYEIYKDGLIVERKGPDNVGLTFVYTATGYLTRVTHTSGRYIQFNLETIYPVERTITDPAGNVYRYSWDADGSNKVTYPDGKAQTRYQWVWLNDDTKVGLSGIEIAGVQYSTYTYDDLGRVTRTEKAGGVESTTYAYFPDRNEVTNALGRKTTYWYEGGYFSEITGGATANCTASFSSRSVDAAGRPDIVIDEKGNATDFDYNSLGQLTRVTSAVGTPAAQVTNLVWSATTGLIQKATEVGVRETSYTYDSLNRVKTVAVKNLLNGVLNQVRTTTYTYTSHPNGILSSVKIDGPITGTGDAITYAFSSSGDLTSVTDGLGNATTYSNHNAHGRVGKITSPTGAVSNITYDARGRVLTMSPVVNGVAQTTTFSYDGAGRLGSVQSPEGVVRSLTYDAAGRLISESEPEPDGKIAQAVYSYNLLSEPTEVKKQRISP